MTTTTFDTLAYVKTLRDAGFSEQQAEGQAVALASVLKDSGESLATKADLKELELRLDARLEVMKADLLKWVVGLFIAQVGLFAALVGSKMGKAWRFSEQDLQDFIDRQRPTAVIPTPEQTHDHRG